MQALKIALVADRFGNRWGGAEAYAVALARELSSQHDITVYARDYDPECGVQLKYVPLKTAAWWPGWLRVLIHAVQVRRLTQGRYDIVHSHSNGWAGDIEVIHVTPVRYNWRVRRLPLLKWAGSFISLRVQTYLWLESRRVAPREGHKTVAVSTIIAQQLQEAYGEHIAADIVPPGVDRPAANVEASDQRHTVRARLGYGTDDVVSILVARNPLRKGLETALQAFAQLPDKHKLLVVGSSPATERAVRSMALFPALSQRLKLIPATSDVTPYYRAADLCVHPTLNDSFGMAPLEAMSFGLPVVISAAPWCGFSAYLTNEQDALVLVDPTDAHELSAALGRLAADADLQTRIRNNGLLLAQRHSWSSVAEQYLALYQDVLAQRPI